MRIPTATYRLQLKKGFGFKEALSLLPYLSDLGISDLYLSPIFQARKGSTHGYDVTDPGKLNEELGTSQEFEELASAANSSGMGILLDIVANHMAASHENPYWQSLLKEGRASEIAQVFDVNWHPYCQPIQDKIILPILGKPYKKCLEKGEITLTRNGTDFYINYQNHRLPVRFPKNKKILPRFFNENSEKGRCLLEELINPQVYHLAYWKTGNEEINYRRFFNINDLIGVHAAEEPAFSLIHRSLSRLAHQGKITGVRVDHIDGISQPRLYLEKLNRFLWPGQKNRRRGYVIVEKILTGNEALPPDWPVHGTTGYEFATCSTELLTCPMGLKRLDALFKKITAGGTNYEPSFERTVINKKRQVTRELFPSEFKQFSYWLLRLARFDREGRDLSHKTLFSALEEITISLKPYRTYFDGKTLTATDRRLIFQAVDKAAARLKTVPTEAFDFLKKRLTLHFTPSLAESIKNQWSHFLLRWQQFTGPITAKGIEDTALYVYPRLLSLNDVGSRPDYNGANSKTEFHAFIKRRMTKFPAALNATSTHDSKRSEDARARISVLSEMGNAWTRSFTHWQKMNAQFKTLMNGVEVPDSGEELTLYQTMLGAWPLNLSEIPSFKKRLKSYAIKALREAKLHTGWTQPNLKYENSVLSFIEKLFMQSTRNPFYHEFTELQRKVAFFGAINSLSQVLLKITCPGVPDFYQGNELWDFSLVDPDNRRPVDYEKRNALLQSIKEEENRNQENLIHNLKKNWPDGRIKLYLTAKALAFRKKNKELFEKGEYIPLPVSGKRRDNLFAFARHHKKKWAFVFIPRFTSQLTQAENFPLGPKAWQNTTVELPGNLPFSPTDILSGETIRLIQSKGSVKVKASRLLFRFPLALLTHSSAAIN